MKDILFNKILTKVDKPARYIGGEYNQAKLKENPNIKFAFAFPDLYEVAMSHLGMKIIYEFLNNEADIMCERVFAPNEDLATLLKENNMSLFTLESFSPLKDFDFLGATIQYEMCLTTFLHMLNLSNIPYFAKDRDSSYPILIAGGPCCVNPMPFADFFDIIFIGESEEGLLKLMGLYRKDKDKESFLRKASLIEGVYIPNVDSLKDKKVKRAFIKDMNSTYSLKKPLVPFVAPIHDRATLEIMRGCPRGCRFCQAGMIYRPMRTKNINSLKEQTDCLLQSTGFEEISLSSLSTTDHPNVKEITSYILDNYKKNNVSLSLPSLRMDAFSLSLAEEVHKIRKSALTFAPEAGSQRLRDVINKNLSEEEILSTIEKAFLSGYSKIKLYFMVGLPSETMEDIKAISTLCEKIVRIYYSIDKAKRGKPFGLSVSTACFVPKPITAFQWEAQEDMESLLSKQKYLKSILPKQVKYSYHEPKLSMLEAVFTKGDRALSKVLVSAYEKGCIFDSWKEYFVFDKWIEAFNENGLDPYKMATTPLNYEDNLPWDFIDTGINKEFLIKESKKSKEEATTPSCLLQCSACGMHKVKGGCKK